VCGAVVEAVVERDEVAVMFRSAEKDEQAEIERAWSELEQAVGSLRGRKFFGAFDPVSGVYRACVALRAGDDPESLELERGALPGGRYVRVRLEGEPPDVYRLIGPTFEQLAAARADRDPSRPSLEYYRRRDQIDLLLPVAQTQA
jgi:hypothetical protein